MIKVGREKDFFEFGKKRQKSNVLNLPPAVLVLVAKTRVDNDILSGPIKKRVLQVLSVLSCSRVPRETVPAGRPDLCAKLPVPEYTRPFTSLFSSSSRSMPSLGLSCSCLALARAILIRLTEMHETIPQDMGNKVATRTIGESACPFHCSPSTRRQFFFPLSINKS